MKTFRLLFSLGLSVLTSQLYAQDYTSLADGDWSSSATWSNTSGWGPSTPPTSGGWGIINVSHQIILNSTYAVGGTLNLNSGSYLTINGNTSISGGSTINVYNGGTLDISGDLTLTSRLYIYPGGRVIVDGSVYVHNEPLLYVGDETGGTTYADLVIKQNLVSHNSGDITVRSNGRVAIYGDVYNTHDDPGSGGTIFTINNGGQVYVHGDVSLTEGGGGDQIVNNNTDDPYGLYVNGATSVTTGGSSATTNLADQDEMLDSNIEFAEWIADQPESPLTGTLPVEVVSFSAAPTSHSIVLSWTTAQEENFDFFTVERAGPDLQFKSIGIQKGAGFSTAPIHYQLEDFQPLPGTNYYRLKATDLDGAVEYHPTISSHFEAPAAVRLYPNPVVQRQFTVSGPVVEVQLMNLMGYTLLTQSISQAMQTVELPGQFQPGTYIALLTYINGTQEKQSLIIR